MRMEIKMAGNNVFIASKYGFAGTSVYRNSKEGLEYWDHQDQKWLLWYRGQTWEARGIRALDLIRDFLEFYSYNTQELNKLAVREILEDI